jgi:hypothetical protein
MNDPLIFAVVIITLALIGNLCLALWVYADAKSKNMKRWLMIMFPILTVMNTGWLILYFILRSTLEQKTKMVVCSRCQADISNDVKFCPNCGATHELVAIIPPKKPKIYLLIAGFFFIIMVFVVTFSGILYEGSYSSPRSLNSSLNTHFEWGNTWKMRFYRSANGTGEHTFKVKGDNWGLISYSEIESGSFKIDFCDADGNLISEILPTGADTLKGVENGKSYKVVVTADNAKGAFSFKMKNLSQN